MKTKLLTIAIGVLLGAASAALGQATVKSVLPYDTVWMGPGATKTRLLNDAGTLSLNGGLKVTAGTVTLTGISGFTVPSISGAANQATLALDIPVTGADATSHTISLGLDGGTAGITVAATGNGAGAVGVTTTLIGQSSGADVVGVGDANADVSITDANWSIAANGTPNFLNGSIDANDLPSAAEDLGAADVEINFGNTNASYNCNLTTDGTITNTINETAAAVDGTRYRSFTTTGTVDPAASAEIAGLYSAYNRTAATNGTFTVQGIEGVARSQGADEAGTFRGGLFRTYTDNVGYPGATARTSVGCEASVRTAANNTAEAGTAFVGSRIWMAPYFTGGTVANVNNFHGLWLYNESTSNAVTNAINISDAGTTGWTYGLNLDGAFIGTADIKLENGDTIDNATDTVITLTSDAAGSEITLQSADSDANADLKVRAGGTGALTLGNAANTAVTVAADGATDGDLVLPLTSVGSGEIVLDTLDFAQFADSPTIDANLVVGAAALSGLSFQWTPGTGAADGAAGDFSVLGAAGGASAAAPGGTGSEIVLNTGNGGVGGAAQVSGDGGDFTSTLGNAGADGGGGGNRGGIYQFTGGNAVGAGTGGWFEFLGGDSAGATGTAGGFVFNPGAATGGTPGTFVAGNVNAFGSFTFTTDGTGTAEVALPAGAIDGTEILDNTIAFADIAADLQPEAATNIVGADTIAGNPAYPVNGIGFGAGLLIFEGSTGGAGSNNETSIGVTDPTGDRAILFPDAGGTVAVSASGGCSLSATGDVSVTGNGIDGPQLADSIAQDSTLTVTGTAGEWIRVDRTLTDHVAEVGVEIDVTAADTTAAVTTQFGLQVQNQASTEGVDALLHLENADADDAVVAAIKISNTGGGGYTNVIDNQGTLISATELNSVNGVTGYVAQRTATKAQNFISLTGAAVDNETVVINGRTFCTDTAGDSCAGDVVVNCNAGACGAAATFETVLAAAIDADSATCVADAVVDPTGTGIYLVALTAGAAGNAYTLAETLTNGDLDNATFFDGADAAVLTAIPLSHTLLANEVARGYLRIDTGLTSVASKTVELRTAAGALAAGNADLTVTVAGGVLTVTEVAAWNAGEILFLNVFGAK